MSKRKIRAARRERVSQLSKAPNPDLAGRHLTGSDLHLQAAIRAQLRAVAHNAQLAGEGGSYEWAWAAYNAAGGRENLTPWQAFRAGLAALAEWTPDA